MKKLVKTEATVRCTDEPAMQIGLDATIREILEHYGVIQQGGGVEDLPIADGGTIQLNIEIEVSKP